MLAKPWTALGTLLRLEKMHKNGLVDEPGLVRLVVADESCEVVCGTFATKVGRAAASSLSCCWRKEMCESGRKTFGFEAEPETIESLCPGYVVGCVSGILTPVIP